MKKIEIILLTAFISCLSSCGSQKQLEPISGNATEISESIDLGELENNDVFSFYDLKWKSTPDEAKNMFGSIEKTIGKQEGIEVYRLYKQYNLFGREVETTLEYMDNMLDMVVITVQNATPEDTTDFYNKILKNLTELYGENNGEMEIDKSLNIIYWQSKKENYITSLQVAEDLEASCNVISLLYETIEEKTEIAIDLNNLNINNSSFFEQFPWKLSKQKVEEMMGANLEFVSEVEGKKNYHVPEEMKLADIGVAVMMDMQFIENKLYQVTIYTEKLDNSTRESLYQRIKEQLIAINGKEKNSSETQKQIMWENEMHSENVAMCLENVEENLRIQIEISIRY